MTKQHYPNHVQLVLKTSVTDVMGRLITSKAAQYLNLDIGEVKCSKVFHINDALSSLQLNTVSEDVLRDPVTQDAYINSWYHDLRFKSYIVIAKRAGVTDDEGSSAQKAFQDYFQNEFLKDRQAIHCSEVYYFEKELKNADLEKLAGTLLGNPLIHEFEYGAWTGAVHYFPKTALEADYRVETLSLDLDSKGLMHLSESKHLCLNLEEMQAIQSYFDNDKTIQMRKNKKLSVIPTDCELEILAQTWSEHCKHKEFNAVINYYDKETNETRQVDSLFKSKIKAATDEIKNKLEEKGHDWLVKVFSDNAGIVKIDNDRHFVWKVETHNTPSALDPYGGAITGILGNNRDALGTGVGGARLLFNTNILCFASPYYDKPLLNGQLHPSRILNGVVAGIMDGGNKSGVPTVNGSIVFDDRFCGKPLVFCGTGAVMPSYFGEKQSWEKPIDNGDLIAVIGGRVGKDGIHGATLSSSHIDASTPHTVVQIGSPMTQKLVSDFLEKACEMQLVKTSTDNGAGGLSSSIGEMAQISGGATVQLETVPLKYSGLKPWEIFLSESQERMTLVIAVEERVAIVQLAEEYEVELSFIGAFNDSGYLEVNYEDRHVAFLDLDFLHNGVPQKYLDAVWQKPLLQEPRLPVIKDYNAVLLKLMKALNICSKEAVIRQYDHEVKGKSIVKPLMGPKMIAPQDAACMRLGFDNYEGLLISNGIIPRYGDIDAYQMSCGAFDEALRQIIAVGGSIPDLETDHSFFWSVNDNFCVPNSSYHPETNPDGKLKLAKLVQMCDGLYDMSTYFNIPMTSGKDSMKNDFKDKEITISIPPTILYSMVTMIPDVRVVTTSEFKAAGDLIYLVGKTYNELGGSEFYHLFGELGANVPIVKKESALHRYRMLCKARGGNLIESCHDISDGGLAVCLAECALGTSLGMNIRLPQDNLTVEQCLFSESHSRFIVTIQRENKDTFENLMQEQCSYLGEVLDQTKMRISYQGASIIDLSVDALEHAFLGGLSL